MQNLITLEESRKITAMVFDKTGTLAEGEFGVTHFQVLRGNWDEGTFFGTVAVLEQQSQHPIAQGIVRAARQRQLPLPAISNFQSITGKGVSATIEGRKVLVVSPGI